MLAKPSLLLLKIDIWLGRITMYNLLLWGLRILTAIGITFSFTHVISLQFWGLVWSLVILIAVCYVTNKLMANIWKIPVNFESYVLTALILFLILPPATTAERAVLIAAAGVIAMVSKFVLTVHDRHIFNPAAFSAVVVGFLGLTPFWWIGSSTLWPFALILGLLIVRKIRRFSLVLTFVAVSLAVLIITSWAQHQPVGIALKFALTSSPLIFLGTIMLTEPATMPAHRRQQVIFGAIVGFLYAMPWNIGPLIVYPETALILGNLYSFVVNPHYRLHLKLLGVERFSDRIANVLQAAEKQGIRVIQLLTSDKFPTSWKGSTGKLSAEFITKNIPDHAARSFYLSGPQPMIESLKITIQNLGAKKIKTDYFTGY
jgi:Na+-transporting NADH:ubiquinone oxidoreductase subunit NqrB